MVMTLTQDDLDAIVAAVRVELATELAILVNGVTLADDAITAAKFDESTAYPQSSPDTEAMVLP